jgi:hypothetical protein
MQCPFWVKLRHACPNGPSPIPEAIAHTGHRAFCPESTNSATKRIALLFEKCGGLLDAFPVYAALAFVIASATARDLDGRYADSPLHDWFNHLASGRGLCCSMADGETIADPDWESKEGHYRVRLDNKWVDVPDEAVITEPNRAGRTMVWPIRFDEQISIMCFMPGSMT